MHRIGLAAVRQAKSVPDGVDTIRRVLDECQKRNVEIVCFSETYLPGLRGFDFDLLPPDQPLMEEALRDVRAGCRETGVAAIVGMEWMSDLGLENRAFVISGAGKVLGYQTKNQIAPGGESEHYVADGKRRVFRVNGTTFGIAICHEAWRYPETVRWPVVRGAQVVFHPQLTWSDEKGRGPNTWGETFWERAMQCRAAENTVYFASVNCAMPHQSAATSLIDPQGNLMDHVPYGEEDLLVADLDLTKATRFLAKRYNPKLYPA
jgi:predicted amidohydrolase